MNEHVRFWGSQFLGVDEGVGWEAAVWKHFFLRFLQNVLIRGLLNFTLSILFEDFGLVNDDNAI